MWKSHVGRQVLPWGAKVIYTNVVTKTQEDRM